MKIQLQKYLNQKSWLKHLKNEFSAPYLSELEQFLDERYSRGAIIHPSLNEVFSALNHTSFNNVKVVILGQDPYHGDGQAHGMCFSVKPDVKVPPSLKNIYKELNSDIGFEIPNHGFLESWADQGVLLLNNVLTVENAKAGSHQKKGWEQFTDKIIETLNEKNKDLVFLLWGAPAQKKARKVNQAKHLVLSAPHPSPLSSYRGFFGCKHFSKCNEFLEEKGIGAIDWNLPLEV
jgi:uracil-DNA glycosylase